MLSYFSETSSTYDEQIQEKLTMKWVNEVIASGYCRELSTLDKLYIPWGIFPYDDTGAGSVIVYIRHYITCLAVHKWVWQPMLLEI